MNFIKTLYIILLILSFFLLEGCDLFLSLKISENTGSSSSSSKAPFTGAPDYFTNNNIAYTNIGNTNLIIVDNFGINNVVVIPGSLYGIPVTGISTSALWYNTDLTSITLPENLTYIESSAFYSCNRLTNITLPASLTSIGNLTFYNCSGLKSVSLPANLTSIEDNTFNGCSGLTNISFPANLTSIGDDAFNGCSGLTEISLPANLTNIKDYAFWHCTGLKNLNMQSIAAPAVKSYSFSGVSGCKLHIHAGTAGYDVAPWTNTGIFSSIVTDL